MKTPSNELLHRFNNKIGLLISSIEAMGINMEDHEYCKEVLTEMMKGRGEYLQVVEDIRNFLEGKAP